MGDMPLMLCIVVLSILLWEVPVLMFLILLSLVSLPVSMASCIQLPRVSEQPLLSPTMRVIVGNGPSLGPQMLLGVVVSSAILDALTIRIVVLRLGGPLRSIVRHAMADQYSSLFWHSVWPRRGPVSNALAPS